MDFGYWCASGLRIGISSIICGSLLLDRLEVYAGSDSLESDPYSDVNLTGSDFDTDGSDDPFEAQSLAFLSSLSKPAKERFKDRDLGSKEGKTKDLEDDEGFFLLAAPIETLFRCDTFPRE